MPRRNMPILPTVVLVFLALAAPRPAQAQSVPGGGDSAAAQLLPAEAAAQLAAKGKAVRSGTGLPAFLPLHPASAAIRDAVVAEKPSILVEAVFALPRARLPGAAARAAELASIYGILRSLGSLQGIEYYSASHKAMRTLYAESWIISGPESKARLIDPAPPLPGALPVAETLFAFQRDLSFGANTYRYDYAAFPGAVSVKSGNLTRMSYGIVPVMAPGGLATWLLVVQADDAILFYALSGASAPGIFKGKLEDSFSNRAEALFRWFSAKYSALNK
jgi:hypothetical protein